LRQFLTFLCPSTGYPHYATAGCEQIDKIFYVNKFCLPTTFLIVLRHWIWANPFLGVIWYLNVP